MAAPVVQDKQRSAGRLAVLSLLVSVIVVGMVSRSAPVVRSRSQAPAVATAMAAHKPHAAASALAGPDPLVGPYVDVARVLPSMAGVAPDLLVVSPPDPGLPGSIHVARLRRDAGHWSEDRSLDVATGLPGAGSGWLVPLGGDVALLAVDADTGRTSVAVLRTAGGSLELVASRVVPLVVAQAGAADLDGDGWPELVLLRSPALRPDDGCPGTRLIVLDGRTLDVRSDATAAGLRLDGASLGRPIGSRALLVAYAGQVCAGVRGAVRPGEVIALDILTGRTIVRHDLQLPSSAADAQGASAPLSVHLAGDVGDVVIVRDGGDTVALDPAHRWRRSVLLRDALPVALGAALEGPPLLTVFQPADRSGDARRGTPAFDLLALSRRSGDGLIVARTMAAAPISDVPADGAGQGAGTTQGAPISAAVWTGDLRDDGCRTILLPRVTLSACAPGGWTVRPGPAWTGTTPIAAYGSPGVRRMLVAAGLDWTGFAAGLATPTPAAIGDGAAMPWRTGPSARFALEELDGADVAYFSVFPSPIIDIDPTVAVGTNPEIVVGGAAGDRVFVRFGALTDASDGLSSAPSASSGPAGPGDPAADAAGRVAASMALLAAPPPPGFGAVRLLPVPAGGTAGANLGAIRVPLPGGLLPRDVQPGLFDATGGLAAAPPTVWRVEAVGINAYGQVSPLASAQVALDRTGPNVALSLPLILAPWPFSAPIDGVTEPGARLWLGDGPPVEAATNGAFELRAQLAPWPQTLQIHAVDAQNNETIRTISVIGGIDYRQLPWQTILIVSLLLGAAVTTWRGPGRASGRRTAGVSARQVVRAPTRFDAVATIEDLPLRSSIPP